MSLGVEKAKKMLREGVARGRALSSRQKRFFGFIAGGGTPTRVKNIMKRRAKKG